MFDISGGVLRRQLDVLCKIRQGRLVPGGSPFGISCCDGSPRSLAIGCSAICVSARIFWVLLDRLAEFLSSGVKMLLLRELDAALHVVFAAALRRFRTMDLDRCATKNRHDRDSD